MPGEEVRDALRNVIAELERIERMQSCAWCRGHIHAYRVYGEDLLALAQMNIDIADPMAKEWLKRIGSWSEDIGVMAVVARFVHRLVHWLKH